LKKTTLLLLLLVNTLWAQETSHTNIWSRTAISKSINSKLKVETEFQKRWQNDITSNSNNPFDYKLMTSVRLWAYYQWNDKFTFIISPFAYYENNPIIKNDSDKSKIYSYENRYTIALEFNLKVYEGLKLQSRTGIEYRDFKNTSPDYFRAREKLSLKYNFNAKFALTGYDEYFFNATNSEGLHNFDQNRLGLLLSYNFIKELKLEIGFIKIERSQKNSTEHLSENDIVLNCYYTLPNKKIKNNGN
jgi:hypothetical protein